MIQMDGKLSDKGGLDAITKLFKDQTVYLGFAKSALTDTSTLATLTETTHVARFDISTFLGTASVVSNVPTLKNDSDIVSGNATGSGDELISWFITTVPSASTGDILAYGNIASGSGIFTNVGTPITVAIDALIITIN